RRTFGTAIGFCFLLSISISALGWITAPGLLDLLATPGEARAMALDYLRMIFVSMPVVMVSIILSMGLRGAGDSRTPLYFMALTVVLDIGLNPLFIRGLGPIP